MTALTRVLKDWVVFLGVLAVTGLLVSQALALRTLDVDRVVGVLEQLSDDLGGRAYDEEAADIWYEEDGAYESRIATAGYSQQTWREAVDRTIKGYFSSLSAAEIEAIFEPMLAFEARNDISASQKEAMRQMVAEWRVKMDDWRSEGAGDAEAVRPFGDRISTLLGGGAEG